MNKKPIFIIAEAGVNHNGDLNTALEMIKVAKDCGADAVKFQTFQADSLATKKAKQARYQSENTGLQESQHDMLKKLELKQEHHQQIKDSCEKHEIEFMSSPFDIDSVNFLEDLQMKIFKIPSGEITNKPLLQRIARINKPTILSTGMSNIKEIEEAISIFKEGEFNLDNLSLLHATSDYPANPSETNMSCIKTLKEKFNLRIGYSDHTETNYCSIIAATLGASIFEKHFTLSKSMSGPDHKASLEPKDLREYIKIIREIEFIIGDGIKKAGISEAKNIEIVRKSLVASKDIKEGEAFSEDNITTKRPGNGISPMDIDNVIGKISKKRFIKDDLIEV